jgi:hypothetical protein
MISRTFSVILVTSGLELSNEHFDKIGYLNKAFGKTTLRRGSTSR